MTFIKICGLKTPDMLSVAAQAGARFAGFVFVPQSPRYIEPEQARLLTRQIPTGLKSVGLFVDPSDDELARTMAAASLDVIQLHGEESPQRVGEIKSRTHLPVIKSFAVSVPADVQQITPYLSIIDWILFDAKAPATSNIAGGNGVAFDWTILKDRTFPKPWMLSGGLTAENIGEALSVLRPDAVDVSSGVEIARGVKDTQKIRDFCAAVQRASA